MSDGGLAVALAECCVTAQTASEQDVGARIDLPDPRNPIEAVALFFGEDPSRIIVSVRATALATVLDAAKSCRRGRGRGRRHGGAFAVDRLHRQARPARGRTRSTFRFRYAARRA